MLQKKLIFLHGWVGKYIINKNENIYDFYKGLIEELKKFFDVEFIILPGFSNNPEPDKPYTLDDYVEYLKKFLEEKGINQFYLMGHSFGGQVACKFAYLYPERVEKLILYNAACVRKKNFKRLVFKKISKLFKNISNIFIKKIIYKILTGTTTPAYYSEVMKKTMSNIIEEDLTEILPQVKVNSLIIWGRKDKLTPLWQGKLIHRLIKNSQLIIHPAGDHNFHKKDPMFIVNHII